MSTCPECLGLGEVRCGSLFLSQTRICPKCFGTGRKKERELNVKEKDLPFAKKIVEKTPE